LVFLSRLFGIDFVIAFHFTALGIRGLVHFYRLKMIETFTYVQLISLNIPFLFSFLADYPQSFNRGSHLRNISLIRLIFQ